MKISLKIFLGLLIVSFITSTTNYFLFQSEVVSEITANAIGASPQELSRVSILKIPTMLIIFLIIISVSTFLLSNSIIKPIKKLRDNFEKMSEEELKEKPKDELDLLTKDICKKMQKKVTDFHEFLDNIDDLIQSVNAKGQFIYVNKKWQETLGYSLQEAKKISFPQIIKKDQLSHCMEIFRQLQKRKTKEMIKTIFVSKSGKEIAVEGNINVKTSDGNIIETRGVFRDISNISKSQNNAKRIFDLGIERELKMKKLKDEIKKLKQQIRENN